MANSPTGGGGGTNIETLGLGLDTTGIPAAQKDINNLIDTELKAVDATEKLETSAKDTSNSLRNLGTVTTQSAKSVSELVAITQSQVRGLVTANDVMSTANKSARAQLEIELALYEERKAALKLQSDKVEADKREEIAAATLLARLNEMVITYGMSTEALLRMQAAQLGVAEKAEPMIATLERQRIGLQQIEYAAYRTMEAQEAVYLKTTEAAEYAAMREMEANESVFLKTEAQRTAKMVAAEREAVAEIRWSEMSTKAKIDQLERLRAYQISPFISSETVSSTFSQAAVNDLPNLAALQRQYAVELANTGGASKKLGEETEKLGVNFSNNRARTELLVLAHEGLQNRWTRMPGSLMVLAEYTNAASLAFTGMGIATLGTVGSLAIAAYEMAKGVIEVNNFNRAITLTGGYTGQTAESIEAMAQSLRGNAWGAIGTTTDMLLALNATGRFTSETLGSVAQAALLYQTLTGKSTDEVAAMFTGIAKVHGRVFTEMTSNVAEWANKQNEAYHFLTAAQYEHIRLLDLEGDAQGAIVETMKLMSESFSHQDEKVGVLIASYRGWVMILQNTAHWLREVGKNWFVDDSTSDQLDKQTAKLEELMKKKLLAKQSTATVDGVLLGPGKESYLEYTKMVEDQMKVVRDLDRKNNAERKQITDTAEDKRISELGVWGAREIDSIKNSNRQKDDIADQYIKRYLEGVTKFNADAINQWNKGYKGEESGRETAMAAAMESGQLKIENEADVAKTIEDIRAKHHNRLKAAENDGYNIRLQTELQKNDAEFQLAKDAVESNEKLLKEAIRSKSIDDQAGYELLRKNRADELSALDVWYKARQTIIDKYTPKKKTDVARAEQLTSEGNSKYTNVANDISSAVGKNDEDQVAHTTEEYNKLIKKIEQAGDEEAKNLDKAIEKQKEHNFEISKTKEQVEFLRAKQMQAHADVNEAEAEAIKLVLMNQDIVNNMSSLEIQAYQKRLEALNLIVAKQRELAKLDSDGAKAESVSPTTQENQAEKVAKQWTAAGNTISKSLSEAFGKAGKSAGDMFKSYAIGQARQAELTKQFIKDKAALVDLDKDGKKTAELTSRFQADSARARMDEYGSMASAAAGFFDENSKGYRALMMMSQIFHAAELAMTIAEMVPKATLAVLNQGTGDPYSAFARMATMAAIVAGLGVAVGAIGGGGGDSSQSSAVRQAAAGKGSVFGDADAKSQSIVNSLSILEKDSGLGLTHSSQMVASLHTIATNISGLTNLVIRSAGVNGISGYQNSSTPLFGQSQGAMIGAGAAAGAYMGSVFGPLGTVAGALIGAAIASLSKVTTTLKDQGIVGSSSTLEQINKTGLDINAYNTVETKKKLVGIKYSDKTKEIQSDLPQDVSDRFTKIVQNLSNGIFAVADTLGLGGDDFIAKMNNFVVNIGHISTKDLKPDEIEKQFQTIFSKIGDDMAQAGLSGLDEFLKGNEGYMEAAIRLANDLNQVKDVFTVMGKQFNKTGLDAIKFSEQLVDAAGGIDNLTSMTKDFFDNFVPESKQISIIKDSLTKAMSDLGYASIKTKDQFTDLVTASLDGTEAGAQLYAQLVKLAPAFSKVLDAEAADYKARLDMQQTLADLEKDDTKSAAVRAALRQVELGKMDASLRPMQERIWMLQDEADATDKAKTAMDAADKSKQDAISKVETAYAALEKVINRNKAALTTKYNAESEAIKANAQLQKTAAQTQLKTAQDYKTAISSVSSSLSSALGSARIESTSMDLARRKEAQVYLGSVRGTDLTKAIGLKDALSDISKSSSGQFSTFLAYARDQAKTAQLLRGLNSEAKTASDLAQDQVDAINDSIAAIDKASTDQLAALKDKYDADTAAQDLILEKAQSQIDALKGIDDSVKTLTEVMADFKISVSAAQSASSDAAVISASTPGAQQAPDPTPYKKYLDDWFGGTPSVFPGSLTMTSGQVTSPAIADPHTKYFNSLPSFDVGTNQVPRDMIARVHKDERIIPAADNRALMSHLSSPRQSNQILVQEIKALRLEVVHMREANTRENTAIQKDTSMTAKNLRKFDRVGIKIDTDPSIVA